MQSALITGGAKRIGRQISLALADRGYTIALHYNTSEEEAKSLEKEIRIKKRNCILLQADLNDEDQAEKLVSKAIKDIGVIDLIINNASVFERNTFPETTRDIFNRHLNVNFKAPFFISQAYASQTTRGHIINILDTKITKLSKYYFSYTLTKKMLYEFTRMAAKELAPHIRVNGICPGLIMPEETMKQSMLESLIKKTPLKQKGGVAYIVSAVNFLLDNEFITGDVIFVDGGRHLT